MMPEMEYDVHDEPQKMNLKRKFENLWNVEYCGKMSIFVKRKNPDSSPALKSGRGTTGTAMQIYEEFEIWQNIFRKSILFRQDAAVF